MENVARLADAVVCLHNNKNLGKWEHFASDKISKNTNFKNTRMSTSTTFDFQTRHLPLPRIYSLPVGRSGNEIVVTCIQSRTRSPISVSTFHSIPLNIVEFIELNTFGNPVKCCLVDLRVLSGVEQSLIAIKHSYNKVVCNNVAWCWICLTEAHRVEVAWVPILARDPWSSFCLFSPIKAFFPLYWQVHFFQITIWYRGAAFYFAFLSENYEFNFI